MALTANESATPKALTVDDAVGAVAESVVLSSRGLGWRGVEVARTRLPFREMSVPALASHTIIVNLGAPFGLTGRVDGSAERGTMAAGGAKIVPAGAPSEWRWETQGADNDVLQLSVAPGFVAEVAAATDVDADRVEVASALGVRDPRMEQVGRSLLAELEGGGLAGGLYVESLSNLLAVDILRRYSSLGRSAARKAAREYEGGLSRRAYRRVTDYVNENLAGELSLAELAGAANMSPYHFSRLFKRTSGLSPHQYVIRRRVERAKGLLVGTDLPLFEVARASGFSDQAHLSVHFKRATRLTPGAFRRG